MVAPFIGREDLRLRVPITGGRQAVKIGAGRPHITGGCKVPFISITSRLICQGEILIVVLTNALII